MLQGRLEVGRLTVSSYTDSQAFIKAMRARGMARAIPEANGDDD